MPIKLSAPTDAAGTAAPTQRFVPPPDIGNGIGGVFESVGNAIGRIAERKIVERDKVRDQQNRVEGAKASAQLNEYAVKSLAELQENWDGVSSLSDALEKNLRTKADELYENASNDRVKNYIAERRETVIGLNRIKSLDIEINKRRANALKGVNEVISSNQKTILSDPSLFESAIADLPEKISALPKGLQDGAWEESAGMYAGAYVAGLNRENPQQLADELEKGILDPYLSAAQKATAISQNETVLKAIDREAKADAKEADRAAKQQQREREAARKQALQLEGIEQRETIKSHFASIQSTGKGVEGVSAAEVARVQGAKAAQRFVLQQTQAKKIYNTLGDIDQVPPEIQAERLQALKPIAGSKTFAEDAAIYDKAIRIIGDTRKRVAKDPVSAVLTNPKVAQMATNAQGSEASTDDLQGFVAVSLAAQADLGIKPQSQKVLTADQASEIAQTLTAENGSSKAITETIGSLQAYGEFQPKVIDEVIEAGANPALRGVSALLDNKISYANPVAADVLVRAINREEELNSRLDKNAKDGLEAAVRSNLSEYMGTFSANPNNLDLETNVTDTAVLMAKEYMARGMSRKDAARKAAGSFSGRYDIEGTYRIPTPYRAIERTFKITVPETGSKINTTWNGTQLINFGVKGATKDIIDNGEFFLQKGGALNNQQKTEAMRANIRTNGKWITNPKETGLMLILQDASEIEPLKGPDGKIIEIPFDNLMLLGEIEADRRASNYPSRLPPDDATLPAGDF